MANDTIDAVKALLLETEVAHGRFEATELNGVYDQDWARWYAAYALEHGIGKLVGHAVAADQLAEFLAGSFGDFQHAEPKPSESWAAYIARRISAEL